MTASTTLRVGSALPDPPFDVAGRPPSGFDVELTQAIAKELGLRWSLHRYEGADFDGIFSELGTSIDIVASGATITEHRKTLATWCEPYVRSGQSLVANPTRTPAVRSTHDLSGLVLGVQEGNTSEPVARALHRRGKVAEVQTYPYDEIVSALDDLEAGRIAGFMKLEPVMRALTADRPQLQVVQTGITRELLAIATPRGDEARTAAVNRAQRTIAARGDLAKLGARWFADSDPSATAVVP